MASSARSQPVALTIAGFDPSGGAGVIADVRTFAAFGCFPTAAITSLTFQNTVGVFGAVHQSAEAVRSQVLPLVEDFNIACLKTGMLPTLEVIEEVARLSAGGQVPAPIVDPVVCSTSGYALIDEKALAGLIATLLPVSRLLTPNILEAELMTGIPIRDEEDMEQAARRLAAMGARAVLLKGGHMGERPERGKGGNGETGRGEGKEGKWGRGETGKEDSEGESAELTVSDLLLENGEARWFRGPRVQSTSTHGTGCSLSAGIAAGLAMGLDLTAAIEAARRFVANAIRTAPGIGHGHGPMNFNTPVEF
jgi:hydroxymethylpyrimidine kinase/phosphomethylpyrimidine kinase